MAALNVFIDDEELPDTRLVAKGLRKQMNKLETAFLTILWNDILSRFDKTSKFLQKEGIDLFEAVKMIRSMVSHIQAKREKMDEYETRAKKKSKEDYKDSDARRRARSSRIAFDKNATEVRLEGSEKFKAETFLPIIDSLASNLKIRLQAYEGIVGKFGFLQNLHDLEEEIRRNSENLAVIYHRDFNGQELACDCVHLKYYIMQEMETLRSVHSKDSAEHDKGKVTIFGDLEEESKESVHTSYDPKRNTISIPILYSHMYTNGLFAAFPVVEIAMRIFLSMMVTNTTGERTFSKLKIIKDERRSTMTQERLNNLSIMSIENDMLPDIDFTDVIKTFAQQKCRKANIL